MICAACCHVTLQAIRVLNMIKVWGKPIRVNKSSQDKRAADVGANLFIGNLDPDVDEKVIRSRPTCKSVAQGHRVNRLILEG